MHKTPSKLTPVKLPVAEIVNIPKNTHITTYGWVNANNDYFMPEPSLRSASVDVCRNEKMWFTDCISIGQ